MKRCTWTLFVALWSLLGAGCLGDFIVDEISTDLTITTPGLPGEPLEIQKRFRFSHDPSEARGVYFTDAELRLLSPFDGDLSFLSRIRVYAFHPVDGPVLIATGEGYEAGETDADLEVVYTEDMRGFATDDSRITFSFIVESSSWSRPYPEEGFTVQAVARIEIDI